jgi:hypothetical protein
MPASVRTIALASAAVLTVPAAAQAQQPTLQFERDCYTEEQQMPFTGAGYTPGGAVDLVFARPGVPIGGYSTQADAAGALGDFTVVDSADMLLEADELRETIFVAANDRTRIEADQQPPESQFGAAQFTFTRWEGYSPGRYVPGGRASVEIFGWSFAAGEKAWVLFRKRSRTLAAVKIGRLDDACGDREARIRVPRKLRPGSYRVVLTTDRRLGGPYTWRKARVTRPRAVAASSRAATLSRNRRVDG